MARSELDYLVQILRAPIYEAAIMTDVSVMNRLSDEIKNKVYLKREDQQPVKSFKLRGAYNCIAQLTSEQKQKWVIAISKKPLRN